MEFDREREEAIAKAVAAGDLMPGGQPATLLEAIVKDYTGRTSRAQAQTIVITALNADRRQVNAMIHDARQGAGEVGEKEVTRGSHACQYPRRGAAAHGNVGGIPRQPGSAGRHLLQH